MHSHGRSDSAALEAEEIASAVAGSEFWLCKTGGSLDWSLTNGDLPMLLPILISASLLVSVLTAPVLVPAAFAVGAVTQPVVAPVTAVAVAANVKSDQQP